VLETDLELPEALISMVRLLLLPDGEWAKARDKGSHLNPKSTTAVVACLVSFAKAIGRISNEPRGKII
jgi:hypothetical protein